MTCGSRARWAACRRGDDASLRVVVYGEGQRDVGRLAPGTAPTKELSEAELGAAHVLVRRLAALHRGAPEASVRFFAPLLHKARPLVGSQLLQPRLLRRALTWPVPGTAPDVAVVLVDQDGDPGRRKQLELAATDASVPVALGVAVEEFEAWLLADMNAVRAAVGEPLNEGPDPESRARQESKRQLDAWCAGRDAAPADLRAAIARGCDVELVARRAPAFRRFSEALRDAL